MSNSQFQHELRLAFKMNPTHDQGELFQRLEDFMRSRNEKDLFILSGYAGTGKTSVVGAFVRALRKMKIKVVLLAPTGRAAKILGRSANQPAYTIHKQIYRRKSSVDPYSSMSLAPNLSKNTVFIVDECSMIGDYTMSNDGNVNARNLLEDLLEYVYTGAGCRLLFLGDEGQLPPVGSEYSPAMNKQYMKEHYPSLHISDYRLNEVLRQAEDSEILYNATLLRSIEWQSYPKFQLSGRGDLLRIDGSELQERIESSYNHCGTDDTIIITRSNKQANKYNQHIRGRILWYEEELCTGDCLMVVKNNYFWQDDQSQMGFIANGELMVVKRILANETLYGFNFSRLLVVFPDFDSVGEQEVIVNKEVLLSEGAALSRERMKELFYEVEKDYLHLNNKRDRYDAILKNPYFNALQVKYAYAVTCHKSQGGQWRHVFIDQGYLTEEMLNADYYRWLYTAITRATEQVFLVNFKSDFFESDELL